MAEHDNFTTRDKCPACFSTESSKLYECGFFEDPIADYLERFYKPQGGVDKEALEKGVYVLLKCATCNTIYQRDILDNSLLTRLYEEWIDPNIALQNDLKKREFGYYVHMTREIMQIMAYFNKQPSSVKFLDFGMGWGNWCRLAQGLGCEVFGCELSSHRIAYAQSRGVQVISYNDISLHQFDFINMEQVLEHVANPLQILQYLRDALTPQGLIKISVPNGHDIERRLRVLDWQAPKGTEHSLNPVAPLEHINCFNRGSIIYMASKAGLDPVNIPFRIRYIYPTSSLRPRLFFMLKELITGDRQNINIWFRKTK